MGATRSRNGSARPRPEEGERGVAAATSYQGYPELAFGKRKKPSVPQLVYMLSVDPWGEALEGALTWPIRSATWSIKEADGDRGEAEEARRQFAPIAEKTIAGACSAIGRRVTFFEQVWSYDERTGLAILEDLAFRPQDQCSVIGDKNGRPRGFKQKAYVAGRGMLDEEFLTEERKAFLYFHGSTAYPGVGKSAFDAAYQHFEDKQKVLFYRYKLLEKYGGPTTHLKTGAQPGTEARRKAEDAARDARSGASIVTGLEDELSYLMPPNAGVAFRQAIQDLNFEMAVSCFVQFLALAQEGNSGAYALSRDHSDFLTIVTEGRMSEMDDAFTAGPIYDLTFFNFGPDAAFPIFEFEPLSENISKRILDAAKDLFSRTGYEMPDWLAEGITEGYARALSIEKPQGAEAVRRDKPEPEREEGEGS